MVTPVGTVHTYVTPDCAVLLKTTPLSPKHTDELPTTFAAIGKLDTVTALLAFTLPQLLLIVNPTLPLTALAVQFVVILFVP